MFGGKGLPGRARGSSDQPGSAPEKAGGAPEQPGGAPEQPGGAQGQPGGPGAGGSRGRLTVVAVVAVVVIVAGAAVVLLRSPGKAGTHRPSASTPARTSPSTRPAPPAALQVVSVTPRRHATRVDGAHPVRVTFSAPVAAGSPAPRITPPVRGSWQRTGDEMVFTPVMPFTPGTEVTVRVPGGRSGVRSAAGGVLAKRVVLRFRTRGWSTVRLEQILAQLRYLPLSWKPEPATAAASAGGTGLAAQIADVYSPPRGKFVWRSGYPSALTSQWSPRAPGVILTGALMAFQSVHGLPMTGTADTGTWKALLRAAAHGQRDPNGYTYALANKTLPETLTVWHDGVVVMHGLANTGIPASPTADGTFPVYLRYRNQVMKGVNPNGTHYADPVQYVSYFNGGDAVHSYIRPSYGFPQSLGCVELPLNEAAQVWPYLTYGSLVTVTG